MDKKKIGVIAGILVILIAVGVGVYLYSREDHSGPSVRVASGYEANYGERIGLFDLVTAVSDESEYSILITRGGQVSSDGRYTIFDAAGSVEVEITAEDEHGNTTVKTVPVEIKDAKPPIIYANHITIDLGDSVDYRTGVTAEDEMDGNLTSQIQVDTSQVDETKAGVYPVIYTVTDQAGNQAVLRTALTIHSPEAETVSLSRQSVSLDGNGHYQLSATVSPSAWSGTVEWSTSNPKVAVVSDGLISWVGTGSCTITARAEDVTAECQVECGYVTVSSIKLNQSSLTLDYQESAELSTKIIPSNWAGDVIWTSSDTTVAVVSDGEVTWAGQGECIITATADGRNASCTVTCNEPEIESVTIEEEEIDLSANGSYQIFPTVVPEEWPGELVWTSSNPEIATVTDGMVRWVSAGTCTITVTADEVTDSCVVNCAEQTTIGDILDGIFGGGDDETQDDPGDDDGDSQDGHDDHEDDQANSD